MRVVFAGTPAFAAVALERVLAAGFDVPLVLTQPDRPAGRGLKLQPSPVKALALERGLDVAQPRSLRLDGRWPDDAAAARAALVAARNPFFRKETAMRNIFKSLIQKAGIRSANPTSIKGVSAPPTQITRSCSP